MHSRETELDILRFIALIAVVLTHVNADFVTSMDIYSTDWLIANTFRALVAWHVPIFVMISGRFFLAPQKEISLRMLYSKYIKRLLIAFVVWSAVYQLYYYATGRMNLNWKGWITEFIIGPYSFWYLWMCVGLYMITPFLRLISAKKQLSEYFILLFFVFSTLVNFGEGLPIVGTTISAVLDQMYFYFGLGFSGYYILGYYLVNNPPNKEVEHILYIMALVMLIFTVIATAWQSRSAGEYNGWFTNYLMPTVIIEATALYTFFCKHVRGHMFSDVAKKFWTRITELSFGVYLIHVLAIEFLSLGGLSVTMASPLITVPVLTRITYILSLLIVVVIRKIPYIGEKIT